MKYYLFVGCGRKCKIKEPRCLEAKNQETKMPGGKEPRTKMPRTKERIQKNQISIALC